MSSERPEAASDLSILCRQIRARSAEHRRGVVALQTARTPALLVSVLRQELDSMIRVMFILSQDDAGYRHTLISSSVRGDRWPRRSGKGYVTEREMVELAATLKSWAKSVYAFGCAFIHLSDLHDHTARDPVARLLLEERAALFEHLRRYHGAPPAGRESFGAVVELVPRVFDKIAGNLECYVKSLERGEGLDR